MKVLGFLLLIPVVLIFVMTLTTRHYDYGVDRSEFQPDCASFFEYGKERDFSTIVWAAGGDCKKLINSKWWPPFYAYTTHVAVGRNGEHSFELKFRNDKKSPTRIELAEDSISVTITDAQGKAVTPKTSRFNKFEGGTYEYRETFSGPLPERLNEMIYFEVKVDGTLQKVEKKYPVKLQFHYSIWDAWMGI